MINNIFLTITYKINNDYKIKNQYNFNDYYYNYDEELNSTNKLLEENNDVCIFVSVIKTLLNKYINDNRGYIKLFQNYIDKNIQSQFLNYNTRMTANYYKKNNFEDLDICVGDFCVKLLQKKNIDLIIYVHNFLCKHIQY